MAGPFKTNKESLKWDYLEATGKQALERVKSGTASKYDYQKVSQILAQYDTLAKSIFDEALATMSTAAQDIVDAIEADREKKGKAPLTGESAERIFDLALKRAFDDFGPEIVETLDSLLDKKLDKKFDDQDELTGMRIDYAVDKIQDFLTKKEARDSLVKDIGEEVEERFRKSIVDVAADMKQQVSKNPSSKFGFGLGGLIPGFGNLSSGSKGGGLMSLLRARLKAGGSAAGRGLRALGAGIGSGVGSFVSRTRPVNGGIQLANPQAQQAVVTGQQKQTSFLQDLNANIKKFIKTTKEAGKTGRDRMKRSFQDMLKKYESMKKFFGDKFGKAKSLAGKGLGWMGNIGKGILTALMYSPLLKMLMEKFGETFSAQNIKEKLGETWDWMKDNAPKALAWVWDKVSNFDYAGVAEKVWDWVKSSALGTRKEREREAAAKHVATAPVIQNTEGGAAIMHHTGMRRTKAAQAAVAATSTGTTVGGNPMTGTNPAAGSTSVPSTKPDLPNEVMKGATTQAEFEAQKKASDAKAAGNTVTAPSGITSNSYVSNSLGLNGTFGGSNTRSAPAQSVMFKSPVIPSTNAPQGQGVQTGLPPANKGGKENVFGLGSFGLVHGVTDTLGLMNLGAVQ